ncbi:MAG: cytochrome b/b6 domain-containing protein [Rubrivivax sp.]|nr:cytochrome b/b6 domain-containing protein [Rubrivivax sp.]
MTTPDDPPAPTAATTRVRVWDLPTRLFHWLLALTVVGSIVTGTIGGAAMTWHFRLGMLALALLVFRLVWGLVGGHWSRFASFIYAPSTLWRYLRGAPRAGEHLDVGHSPLGAASVFAMLAILVVQVGTGLVADDEIANVGPLNRYVATDTGLAATAWHKNYGEAIIITLVVLHVAAVLFYRLRRRKDLIGPMIGGDKALPAAAATGVPASRDDAGARLKALVLAVLAAALAWWVMRLGG